MNTKKVKLPTVIHFILDRSGSMESCKGATISGFNEYINSLKKEKNKILFSLTTFDSGSIDTLYKNIPVEKVKKLNTETFNPRGMTPLYDAVVDTIEKFALSVKKKQPALVVIMTDGEENASHNHTQECLKDLVEKLQSKGNWTFVFLGANQDTWANASSYGMSLGNSTSWVNDYTGTKTAFNNLRQATAMFCSAVNEPSAQLSVKDFFDSKGAVKDVS